MDYSQFRGVPKPIGHEFVFRPPEPKNEEESYDMED